jgi:hypothetical protein
LKAYWFFNKLQYFFLFPGTYKNTISVFKHDFIATGFSDCFYEQNINKAGMMRADKIIVKQLLFLFESAINNEMRFR